MVAAALLNAPLPLLAYAATDRMSAVPVAAVWYLAYAALFVVRGGGQRIGGLSEAQSVSEARTVPVSAADKMLAPLRDLRLVKFRYFVSVVALASCWPLFAAALRLADPAVATVIYEFWPVLFALFTLTAFWKTRAGGHNQGRIRRPGEMLVLLTIAGCGVMLAALSDSELSGGDSGNLPVVGMLLALVAAIGYAVGGGMVQIAGADAARRAANPASGTVASAEADDAGGGSSTVRHVEARAMASVLTWSRLLIGLGLSFATVAAVLAGIDIRLHPIGVLLAALCGTVNAFGGWLFHLANQTARHVVGYDTAAINGLYYLAPIAALGLLAVFDATRIARPDLLICGAAGVVAVNMVMHLDPEGAQQRTISVGAHGYKAIVLALWMCGTAVLLRDDWLPETWQVWSVMEYWGMIGVLATVFILILSFRQSRLTERRRETDRLTLSVHQQIAHLNRTGRLSASDTAAAVDILRRLETASSPTALRRAYLDQRKHLIGLMKPDEDPATAELLSDALLDTEVLVNLRQQGRNFAELAVLTMFAAMTVALTLTARPGGDLAAFAEWVNDTASMVVAAAFAFLGFDLIDKRREADAPLLRAVSEDAQSHGQPPGWRLEMIAYHDQTAARRLAAVLGAALLIGAVVMLGIQSMSTCPPWNQAASPNCL